MRLRKRDLEGVLSFVADAHDVDAPEPLTTELLDRLAELFGCELASYEEYDWRRRVVNAYVRCSNEDPRAVAPPYVPDDFWSAEEWPFRPGPDKVEKLSDRFDRRERERRRDEEVFNSEFRIVDSIGLRVWGDRRTQSGWLHFDSQRRDFGERDRRLVLALGPHVAVLKRRATSRRQATELVEALEADRAAIVVHEAGGRIVDATTEAQRLLATWFGTQNVHLPQKLDDWLGHARPGDRYTQRRNGSILTVEATGESTLTLREDAVVSGLTSREHEVLGHVADGLTNAQIAGRLWVAESTVAKHLEQAYAKLGVHSRTAAVARLKKVEG